MEFLLSKYIPVFLFPLGLSLALLVICLITVLRPGIRYRRRKIAALIFISLLMLWSAGCPFVSDWMMSSLEGPYLSAAARTYPRADAIVVLSGSAARQQAQSRKVLPGRAFDRLYLGCQLYREKKAPVMVLSGGGSREGRKSGALTESELMFLLARQLGLPERSLVTESHSRNTRENAWFTREILQGRKGKGTVLLVTSAYHMPRAKACFEKLGMIVTACPADFKVDPYKLPTPLDFLPDAEALDNTTMALREYIGLLYYRLRGWV